MCAVYEEWHKFVLKEGLDTVSITVLLEEEGNEDQKNGTQKMEWYSPVLYHTITQSDNPD